MLCSSCGRMIPNDARFCRYCGKGILSVEEEKKDNIQENILEAANDDTSNSGSIKECQKNFNGYAIICVVVLVIVGGLMFMHSMNNTSYDRNLLKEYTCTGDASQISILIPFELNDEDPGPLDDTVVNMVYKMGVSGNFKLELVGVRYTDDMADISELELLDNFVSSLKGEKNISHLKQGKSTNVRINGISCAKQIIKYNDLLTKNDLESIVVLFRQDDEIWIILTAYKTGDKEAGKFSEHIINSIRVK